jgi:type III secretion protein U
VSCRTEAPTPRRLREGRRRGEALRSREWSGAAALLAGGAAAALAGPSAARELARGLRAALAAAAAGTADPAAVLAEALATLARLSALPCLAAAAAAGAAALLAAGPAFAPEALSFRAERLDPFAGLRRLVSAESALQALLGVAKAAALAGLAWAWLAASARELGQLPRLSPGALIRAAPLLSGLALRLALALAAFAALDLLLARVRHLRALRMTKDEVRREHKEDEGDPLHKAERRRRHRALAQAVPVSRATVVVVNPTHLAVALHHDAAGGGAPVVVAKGQGPAARAIRSAARRAGVPIVRYVPLARALHSLAEVGDEIPEDLYDAAAAVLAHLHAPADARPTPEDAP